MFISLNVIFLWLAFLNLGNTYNWNGILGEPYVNCGSDAIDVRFDTQNSFHGIVFVKDHLKDPECRSNFNDSYEKNYSARNTHIKLKFDSCGIERKKINNSKGLVLKTTLVVAFNSDFLTKSDRVFDISCSYMESQTECDKEILIRMPPESFQTKKAPMPVCKYELLEDNAEGAPLFYATVGQKIYHKWTCEEKYQNMFCMTVHSCNVDDGKGDRVELIDQNGCAHDKHILQNLDYVSDLFVGKEAHVYTYADRSLLFFDCKIKLRLKQNNICDVPKCPDLLRSRRENNFLQALKNHNTESSFDTENTNKTLNLQNYINDYLVKETNKNECFLQLTTSLIAAFNLLLLIVSGLLFRNAYKFF